MEEKIILDSLNQNSVSIKRQKCITIDGVIYSIGQPSNKGYYNSIQGREEIKKEVSEPYKSAIFSIWGDVPTIEEVTEINS